MNFVKGVGRMKNLTEGNIYKNFIWFAIPLILAALFSQAYNTIDMIIAGRFLGEEGLAAIGATSTFLKLVSSVFWGYAGGFGVYVAKLFGAKEFLEIKSQVINVCVVFMAALVVCSGGIMLCWRPIFVFLQVEEAIWNSARNYFLVYVAGLVLVLLNNFGIFVMHAVGCSSFPFTMSVLSAVINVAGNIVSVAVLHWGTIGIAVSTLLAALSVDVCYARKVWACFREMGVEKEPIRFSPGCIKDSWKYSVPVTVQQTAMYLASMAMSPVVNGIGSAATAGYVVVLKIYDFNATIYQQSSKTVSNYAAQCVGAKKYRNLKKGLWVGLLQGVVFVVPVIAVCWVFARPLCRAFFPAGYAGEGLEYAVRFVLVYLPMILINLLNNLFHAFYRGIAAMKWLMSSTFIGAGAWIGLSLWLAPKMGIEGIYLGWVLSWIIEVLFSMVVYWFRYRTTDRIEKEVTR